MNDNEKYHHFRRDLEEVLTSDALTKTTQLESNFVLSREGYEEMQRRLLGTHKILVNLANVALQSYCRLHEVPKIEFFSPTFTPKPYEDFVQALQKGRTKPYPLF